MKKLKLGDVQVTRDIYEAGLACKLLPYFLKHEAGEWGELDPADAAMQNIMLAQHPEPDHGSMFISVWDIEGQKVWIITHYGYATTALFPREY